MKIQIKQDVQVKVETGDIIVTSIRHIRMVVKFNNGYALMDVNSGLCTTHFYESIDRLLSTLDKPKKVIKNNNIVLKEICDEGNL